MRRSRQTSSRPAPSQAQSSSRREPVVRVLLVDSDPNLFDTLVSAIGNESIVFQADNAAEARNILAHERVDLAVIDPQQTDGAGLALAHEIRSLPHSTDANLVVLSHQPSMEESIAAIRAGASDYIIKPADPTDLTARLRAAVERTRASRRITRRLGRLRRVCRKLNEARRQVTQQVDILCNDLVNAYQELAGQMQQISQTHEYAAIVDHELDLEQLLRKTLEYLLQKAGPTNAVIFLPSNDDEYTVGAYVNYDTTQDSAQLLLQHMADVLAPRTAERDEPIHLTDNTSLTQWLGDDSAYLADSHVVALAARLDNEALAVIMLFRDASEPYPPECLEACAAIGPMLAEYLSKIIRVHHRHLPDPLDDEQG